jgi:hypothetical protein
MFGIGQTELLILCVILVMTVVPGVLGMGVLIWLIVRKKSSPVLTGAGTLVSCADCGGKISRQAKVCPHCGRPAFGGEPDVDR